MVLKNNIKFMDFSKKLTIKKSIGKVKVVNEEGNNIETFILKTGDEITLIEKICDISGLFLVKKTDGTEFKAKLPHEILDYLETELDIVKKDHIQCLDKVALNIAKANIRLTSEIIEQETKSKSCISLFSKSELVKKVMEKLNKLISEQYV